MILLMTAVLQRVKEASVTAEGAYCGHCGQGLMILLGVHVEDTEEDALLLAEKISKLRIFTDAEDKMNLSVRDIGGSALVVSNFTLNANYAHGNRPDYLSAARPEVAEPLYLHFTELLRERGIPVENGRFGASMEISMRADGPVTIVMDSTKLRKGKNK